jgi:hypothetical protein
MPSSGIGGENGRRSSADARNKLSGNETRRRDTRVGARSTVTGFIRHPSCPRLDFRLVIPPGVLCTIETEETLWRSREEHRNR